MVWSVLLLVEMVLSYLNLAANFPVLCVDVVQRVVDLFRVRTNTHPPTEGQSAGRGHVGCGDDAEGTY